MLFKSTLLVCGWMLLYLSTALQVESDLNLDGHNTIAEGTVRFAGTQSINLQHVPQLEKALKETRRAYNLGVATVISNGAVYRRISWMRVAH